MQAWMEGYTSDVEYTAGYYREQEPDFLNLCAVLHGVAPVDLEQGFTYCELGCGMGMTTLIMAANYPQGKFYALDFNPSHIAKARRIAKAAGLNNVTFLEKSFADLDKDPSLVPECDFIALHGIFTWVSDENRQHIINICKRHLKSGGMVYNSYNAKPGWVMGEPLQKLVYESSKLFSGNSITRLDQAVSLLKSLEEASPRFFAINRDVIKNRMEMLESKDKHYLVHEYFHEGWRAFYFTEVAGYMADAKLDFLGAAVASATFVERLMPQKARELLQQIPNSNTRELFKDTMFNTMFRKDIFMRGTQVRLNAYEQLAWLENTQWSVRKTAWLEKEEYKLNLPGLGEVTGKTDVYRAVLHALADNAMGFRELQQRCQLATQELLQALVLLYQEEVVGMRVGSHANSHGSRLNKVLVEQAFNAQRGAYISLPATRGAVALSLTDILFFRALTALGVDSHAANIVAQVAKDLESRGLHLTHEGKNLTGEAMRGRLRDLEAQWRKSVLSVLRAADVFTVS